MEYDLKSTEWILNKVRFSEVYAQNLYAAMCNNKFQKNDIIPILKNNIWSCSWRYAGSIISDMRREGNYMEWYGSGMNVGMPDEEVEQLTSEQKELYEKSPQFVSEGIVTDEIKNDLFTLGWVVLPDAD